MRSLFLGAVAVALAVALGAPALTQAGDQVERGKQVYADQKCKMCHAIEGTGNKKGPLDEVGSKLSVEEIKQWVVDPEGMTAKAKAERTPKMKNKYDKLPAEDIDALVAYLASLKKAEG